MKDDNLRLTSRLASLSAIFILLTACGDEDEAPADNPNNDAQSECGDGTCDTGENTGSCPDDCPADGPTCGDGTCDEGEDTENCAEDCPAEGPLCGDGSCDEGEDSTSCPDDCPPQGAVCGDGNCDEGEDNANCPDDCEAELPDPVTNADCEDIPVVVTLGEQMFGGIQLCLITGEDGSCGLKSEPPFDCAGASFLFDIGVGVYFNLKTGGGWTIVSTTAGEVDLPPLVPLPQIRGLPTGEAITVTATEDSTGELYEIVFQLDGGLLTLSSFGVVN